MTTHHLTRLHRASLTIFAEWRFRMRLFILLSGLLLAACASPTVTEVRSPSGSVMKNVKCPADEQKCFESARESCTSSGGIYQVVQSHSNAGGTLADLIPGPVTWYNMTYVCGPSDGAMPQFAFRGQQYAPPAFVAPTIVQQPVRRPRSTMTNCTRIGESVNCTTY